MDNKEKLPEETQKEIKGHPPSPDQEDKFKTNENQDIQGQLQHELNAAEEKKTKSKEEEKSNSQKRFLFFYIIALFSIALVLIGMSYMTQVKANRLNSQLDEQTTAAQGAKAKVEELQNLLDEQEKIIEDYNRIFGIGKGQTAEEARKNIDDKTQALEYLWQLEKNYQKNKYDICEQIIDQMESAYGDKIENRGNGILSGTAWDEYNTIRQAVAREAANN